MIPFMSSLYEFHLYIGRLAIACICHIMKCPDISCLEANDWRVNVLWTYVPEEYDQEDRKTQAHFQVEP